MSSVSIDWSDCLALCTKSSGDEPDEHLASNSNSSTKSRNVKKKKSGSCPYHQAMRNNSGRNIACCPEYCVEIHPALENKKFKKQVDLLQRRYVVFANKPPTSSAAAHCDNKSLIGGGDKEKRLEVNCFLELFQTWVRLFFRERKQDSRLLLVEEFNCRNLTIVQLLSFFLRSYLSIIRDWDLLVEYELYAMLYHFNRSTIGVCVEAMVDVQRLLWKEGTPVVTRDSAKRIYKDTIKLIEDIDTDLDLIQSVWSMKEMQVWNRVEQLCFALNRSLSSTVAQTTAAPSSSKNQRNTSSNNQVNGSCLCLNEIRGQIDRYEAVRGQIVLQNREIIHDLYYTLSSAFEEIGYRVVCTTFGSRISELADLTSDLDIALSLYRIDTPEIMDLPVDRLNIQDRATVLIDSKKKVSETFLKTIRMPCITTTTVLKLIRKQVQRSGKFTMREYVVGARIPIIKLMHRRTRVEVDICVENQLGVQNTMILKDYMNLPISRYSNSQSIREFLLSIKYWAKERCCNQSPHGTLSTFSWCLMAIYSLLQEHLHGAICAPRVTTTDYGKEMIRWNAEKEKMTDSCPVAFASPERRRLFELIAPVCNTMVQQTNPLLLLVRFFAFYGTDCIHKSFDFCTQSISIVVPGQDPDFDDKDEMEKSSNQEDSETSFGELIEEMMNPSERYLTYRSEQFGVALGSSINDGWRTNVKDCFDRRNLGKCIRNIHVQEYMQGEIRRGLSILLSGFGSNPTQSITSAANIWHKITERNTNFHDHTFSLCVNCDRIRHADPSWCPQRTCSFCGWVGHQVGSCFYFKESQKPNSGLNPSMKESNTSQTSVSKVSNIEALTSELSGLALDSALPIPPPNAAKANRKRNNNAEKILHGNPPVMSISENAGQSQTHSPPIPPAASVTLSPQSASAAVEPLETVRNLQSHLQDNKQSKKQKQKGSDRNQRKSRKGDSQQASSANVDKKGTRTPETVVIPTVADNDHPSKADVIKGLIGLTQSAVISSNLTNDPINHVASTGDKSSTQRKPLRPEKRSKANTKDPNQAPRSTSNDAENKDNTRDLKGEVLASSPNTHTSATKQKVRTSRSSNSKPSSIQEGRLASK